jgi:hypothetical protein
MDLIKPGLEKILQARRAKERAIRERDSESDYTP